MDKKLIVVALASAILAVIPLLAPHKYKNRQRRDNSKCFNLSTYEGFQSCFSEHSPRYLREAS